jgi:heavy-metal-associated domain-containing protein
MPDTPPRSRHHVEVASHIPGRLRVRVHRHSRHSHVMMQLKKTIEEQQGVHGVEVNHAAGSITVKYDAQTHRETGIFDLLEDLDVIVGTVMDAPQIEAPTEGDGHSKAAVTLTGALDDLDKRVAGLTGHTVNLRTLFPLSLAGLGVWRILESGLMLEMVPGWLLLWLAFDSFVKLHPPARQAWAVQASG